MLSEKPFNMAKLNAALAKETADDYCRVHHLRVINLVDDATDQHFVVEQSVETFRATVR